MIDLTCKKAAGSQPSIQLKMERLNMFLKDFAYCNETDLYLTSFNLLHSKRNLTPLQLASRQ